MSPAQQHALLLGSICLFAAIVLGVVLALTRVNRFGVFAAVNLLLATTLFGMQVVFDFSGWRAEILVASVSELPIILLLSWVCLAQAGGPTSGSGSLPSEMVVRHPRVRVVLGWAPATMIFIWLLATFFGLACPSPAMQPYTSAPPQFLMFKWPISASQTVYAGLSAFVLMMVAVSPAGVAILRLRNFAFSLSMFSVMLIAAESVAFGGVRAWAGGQSRREIAAALLGFEAVATILCFVMLALGVALQYTPSIASAIVRKAHTGWLPARERLEATGWHALTGGRTRGLARVTYRLREAARVAELPQPETERAVAAVRLMAVIRDPSAETGKITPEAARELYDIEREVMHDEALASRINDSLERRWTVSDPQQRYDGSLQEALKATIDLTDNDTDGTGTQQQPLWFHLVAVATADVGLVDAEDVRKRFGAQRGHEEAVAAYDAARDRLRSQTFRRA